MIEAGTRVQVTIDTLPDRWAYRGLRTGLKYWVEYMGFKWIFINYPSCIVDWDNVTEVT